MAYLTDNKAARTHSEGFLHEASEGNLAGTFKIRLPALHGDDVGQPQLKRKECVSTDVRARPMTTTNQPINDAHDRPDDAFIAEMLKEHPEARAYLVSGY